MQNELALAYVLGAVVTLIALCVVDLRVRLLPNRLVFIFALTGIGFHIATNNAYLTAIDTVLGALLGSGILYGIRFVANRIYQQDTLGLGDVKLLGAAGLWLGVDGVLGAMTLGAVFGLLHGLLVACYNTLRHKTPFNLSRLEIPAGPGFALGIIAVGVYQFGFQHTGLPWPGH